MRAFGLTIFRHVVRLCIPTLTLLTAIACATSVGVAEPADSLPISAALTQQSFPPYIPISLSPDGDWVAYTLQAPERIPYGAEVDGFTTSGVPNPSVGCTVWLANVATRETIRLSGPDNTSGWAPQWSPDGRSIAFYSDQSGTARLWVWNARTRTARAVSSAVVRPYTGLEVPRWTPDSHGVITRILPLQLADESAQDGADGESLAGDTTGRAPGSTVVVYRRTARWGQHTPSIPLATTHAELFYSADLALIDVPTGAVYTLAHGFRPFDYWVSPDGRFVAFTSLHGLARAGSMGVRYPLDLMVVSVRPLTGQIPRAIASTARISLTGAGFAWSPDSRALMYAVVDSGGDTFYVARCCGWPSQRVVLADSLTHALSSRTGEQPLRWDPGGQVAYVSGRHVVAAIDAARLSGRVIAWTPHGQSLTALLGRGGSPVAVGPEPHALFVGTRDDVSKCVGFARIDLPSGRWTSLQDEERYRGEPDFAPYDMSADGRRIVYASEGAALVPNLWTATRRWSAARQITDISPHLSGRSYGESRLVTWLTSAGDTVRGSLLLPVEYANGHRYPMIVYPYPQDARSNDLYQFGLTGAGTENMQLLATRGYAVFAPDAPIHPADQLHSIAEVILPGIDRVIRMGIADSSRIGLMGHSWGGYAVLALLVQTHRFRAAVMRGGFGDVLSIYGDMETTGAAGSQVLAESWFNGTPWDDPRRYLDNSPILMLDRVRTPLLIIHGGAETTVPAHHADEIFVDLRRLGQEVEYAKYGGENHSEDSWTSANQRDYIERLIRWFDTHLKSDEGDSGDVRSGRD